MWRRPQAIPLPLPQYICLILNLILKLSSMSAGGGGVRGLLFGLYLCICVPCTQMGRQMLQMGRQMGMGTGGDSLRASWCIVGPVCWSAVELVFWL